MANTFNSKGQYQALLDQHGITYDERYLWD